MIEPSQTPQPGEPRAARVPRTTESVSAGAMFGRMITGLLSLSGSIDDAEKEYGPKVYASMMNDPTVGSCVDVLRQAAVRQPTLTPPKELRTKPGLDPTPEEAKADAIAAFAMRALTNPARPLVETLNEFAYGLVEDKLAEIVLEPVVEGPDRGRLTFGAFKFKPRDSWSYVVDAYGNLKFIAGVLPADVMPPPGDNSAAVAGAGGNTILLEIDRFAIFAWGRRDSDPRCRPITRRAYNGWNLKVRTWPEKLKGDAQFGTPSIDVTMPEKVTDPDPTDVEGLRLADGSPVETAEDLFAYQAERAANGSYGLWPFGTTVQVRESGRSSDSLNASIDLYNREIAAAILHAPRTTMEAKNGSKADSESSGDVTQLLVDLIRAMLCGLIRNALRDLVRLNDGPDAAARMVPDVSMGDVSHQDLPALLTAFSGWVKSGGPTPNQMPEIDAKLDITPRTPGEKSIGDLNAERAAKPDPNDPKGDGENADPPPTKKSKGPKT